MGTKKIKIEHSQRSHALLSASGASRWLACTPSARLENDFGKNKKVKTNFGFGFSNNKFQSL